MAKGVVGEYERMEKLSSDFKKSASEVESLTSRLDGIVNGVVGSGWQGNAADRFRDLWQGEFKSALKKLDAALADASREVDNRKRAFMQADN